MIKVKMSIQFEPRDIWIGVRWRHSRLGTIRQLYFLVCLLPMLPISIRIIRARLLGFK